MIVSNKMKRLITEQEGWTRKMFEEGMKLKERVGEENVFDFSLGNPHVEPPKALHDELVDMLTHPVPGLHRYMENNGYRIVREQVADYLTGETGLPFSANHVFMSVGCAGGLNILLKTMLNRGDEVIVPNPFFWEFKNYIQNFGGIVRLVETTDDFQLDIEKIDAAITKKTRAILVNSPNNPTGTVYRDDVLRDLAALLYEKRRQGQEIFIIADEAYRKLVYGSDRLPNLFSMYDLVLSVTSHSKDLALPGERIGYIAISPHIRQTDLLVSGLMISARSLGFVNAPALFQRAVGKFQSVSVDIREYEKKRDLLYGVLDRAGFECVKPMGAFYMFPKSPVENELDFVRDLQQEERILVVPGRGFGKEGYFRIAYCVPMEKIEGALEGFERIGKKYIQRKG